MQKGNRADTGEHRDHQLHRAGRRAGCTWKDVDAATQDVGLAVTGGLVSSTGIAGFTTGGGIGWLMRHYGLACDNLVAVDIVTADGQLVHASAEENPDLFWGVRGGGGNFGVVTSFEFQLHEVGPTVLSGLVFYPAEEAEQVLRGYRDACADAPDELTTLVNFTTAPPVPFLPESVHGTPIVAVGGCWSGPAGEGEAAVAPFRSLGTVISDVCAENPYPAWQQALDPLYPRGLHNYFRSAFLRSADDESMDVLVRSFAAMPNALTEIHLQHLGGAVGRVQPDSTAYAMRDEEFIVNIVARTQTADGFGAVVDWARSVTGQLGPQAATYVNFTGEAAPATVAASYPNQTYRRLVDLKNRYDPTNLFALNQNIVPHLDPYAVVTERVVRAHLQAFLEQRGVPAIVVDYADHARFVTAERIYRGRAEIGDFFTGFLAALPAGALENFALGSLQVDGRIGYVTWTVGADIPLGTDTFVVEDGKIVDQTFAMFVAPAA